MIEIPTPVLALDVSVWNFKLEGEEYRNNRLIINLESILKIDISFKILKLSGFLVHFFFFWLEFVENLFKKRFLLIIDIVSNVLNTFYIKIICLIYM